MLTDLQTCATSPALQCEILYTDKIKVLEE